VNTVAEAVEDAQYSARGAIADAVDATAGAFRQAAPIWAGTVPPRDPYEIRDGAITDTVTLLEAAGVETARIDALLEEGAIA
jgi:crotonobetainyl-CoA:carnitine CoA-transferase CaiB-like acyl-CoA transferase